MLDFDGAEIHVYGEQSGKFFNRYYDHYYFPLYVFCGRHSYLRTTDRSDSCHS
ncbi:hypothetical protein GCM10009022_28630 [Vreelandella titanicae]